MTDDQLRAMARRVLGLLAHRGNDTPCGSYWGVPMFHGNADEVESAAVAILREEMAKAERANALLADVGEVFGQYIPDDPTQTIVIDT